MKNGIKDLRSFQGWILILCSSWIFNPT